MKALKDMALWLPPIILLLFITGCDPVNDMLENGESALILGAIFLDIYLLIKFIQEGLKLWHIIILIVILGAAYWLSIILPRIVKILLGVIATIALFIALFRYDE